MHVNEAIKTVLAVRSFRDEPVPEVVIREILDAGRLTASAGNDQRWDFLVVRDRQMLRKLTDVSGRGPSIANSAFAIVVVTDPSRLGLSDASRAIQNMILAAWAHGVGSNWTGFSKMLEMVNPVLGIPEDHDVVAIMPMGYPANETLGKGRKKRKPFDEVVHWETWGNHTAPQSSN